MPDTDATEGGTPAEVVGNNQGSDSESDTYLSTEERLARLREAESQRVGKQKAAAARQRALMKEKRDAMNVRLAEERDARAEVLALAQERRREVMQETMQAYNGMHAEVMSERHKRSSEEHDTAEKEIENRRKKMKAESAALREAKIAMLEKDKEAAESSQVELRHHIGDFHRATTLRKERVDKAMQQFYSERRQRSEQEKAREVASNATKQEEIQAWNATRQTQQSELRAHVASDYTANQRAIAARTQEVAEERQRQRDKADEHFKEKRRQGFEQSAAHRRARQEEERSVQKQQQILQADAKAKLEAHEAEVASKVAGYQQRRAEAEARKQDVVATSQKRQREEQESFEQRVNTKRKECEQATLERRAQQTDFWGSVLQRRKEFKESAQERRRADIVESAYREKLTNERVKEVEQDTFWHEQDRKEWERCQALLKEIAAKKLEDKRAAVAQENARQALVTQVRSEERVERKDMAYAMLRMRAERSQTEAELMSQQKKLKREQAKQNVLHAKRQTAAQVKAESELCRRVWKEERTDVFESRQRTVRERFHEEVAKRNSTTSGVTLKNRASYERSLRKHTSPTLTEAEEEDTPSDSDTPSVWAGRPPATPTYMRIKHGSAEGATFEQVLTMQNEKRTQLFRPYLMCSEPTRKLPGNNCAVTSAGSALTSWARHVREHIQAEPVPLYAERHHQLALLCSCLAAMRCTLPGTTATPETRRRRVLMFDPLHYLSRTTTGRQQLLHLASDQLHRGKRKAEWLTQMLGTTWVITWLPAPQENGVCDVFVAFSANVTTEEVFEKVRTLLADSTELSESASLLAEAIAPPLKSLCTQLHTHSGSPAVVTFTGCGVAGEIAALVAGCLEMEEVCHVATFGGLREGSDRLRTNVTCKEDLVADLVGMGRDDLGSSVPGPHPFMVTPRSAVSQTPPHLYFHAIFTALCESSPDTPRSSFETPEPPYIPQPCAIQLHFAPQGTLNTEGTAQCTELFSRFCLGEGSNAVLDMLGYQLIRKHCDGVVPWYLAIRSPFSDGADKGLPLQTWLDFCLATLRSSPWIIQKLFHDSEVMLQPNGQSLSRTLCYESGVSGVTWDVTPLTDLQGDVRSLSAAGVAVCEHIFSLVSMRRDGAHSSKTAAKSCMVTFLTLSSFAGDPISADRSSSELYEELATPIVIASGVHKASPAEVFFRSGVRRGCVASEVSHALFTFSAFQAFFQALCFLDEGALCKRLSTMGFAPSLRIEEVDKAVSRGVKLGRNIHEHQVALCPCSAGAGGSVLAATTELMQGQRRKRNVANDIFLNTAPVTFSLSDAERCHAVTVIEQSAGQAKLPLHERFFTQAHGKGTLLIPKVRPTRYHDLSPEKLAEVQHTVSNPNLREAMARLTSLESDASQNHAPKVAQTSVHLYSANCGKEILFDQYVNKMDAATEATSVHRGRSKKVYGVDRRIYDSTAIAVHKESGDGVKKDLKNTPLGPVEERVIENLYTNPMANQLSKSEAVYKKHDQRAKEKPAKKYPEEVIKDIVTRNTEVVLLQRRKKGIAALRAVLENDNVPIKWERKDIAELTGRLYTAALQQNKEVMAKAQSDHCTTFTPPPTIPTSEVQETARRLCAGEKNQHAKLPRFYERK